MKIPEHVAEFIDQAESMGALISQLETVRQWPGLSGAQRAAATCLATLTYLDGVDGVQVRDIAGFLSITDDRAQRLFVGIEKPPFELRTIGTNPSPVWCASGDLDYGA